MTANYLVCNIEVTKKRGKSKRKVYFSFLFRVPVTSTVTNRLGSLHVRCPGVCKWEMYSKSALLLIVQTPQNLQMTIYNYKRHPLRKGDFHIIMYYRY